MSTNFYRKNPQQKSVTADTIQTENKFQLFQVIANLQYNWQSKRTDAAFQTAAKR